MPTFKVVPVAEAAKVKEAVQPEWRSLLREGRMLLMDKRPNWHGLGSGYTMRSKTAPDGKGVYVWMEERPPVNVAPVAPRDEVGTMPAFSEPDLTGIPPLTDVQNDPAADLMAEAEKVFAGTSV
jgi:hypothetical protein